ncbi:MAG TPA: hypothetical protein VMG99_02575 [Thermoplasmata archaeon]|nr:hypothetical protein [Thermoplasmata archaeon]
MESPLRPLPDRPILRVAPPRRPDRPFLVAADVHLGLGGTRERPGGPPGANAESMAALLVAAARATGADRVVLAGDVKHPIVGTPPALRRPIFDFCGALLGEGLAVDVVLGNHDVGLVRHLPAEVVVHPARGIVVDGVGIFHGHRWPSNAVLRAPRLVVGHLHPGYRLAPTADDPSGKRPVWLRATLPGPPARRRRRTRRAPIAARELVVVPALNPIAGTEALNRARPARGRSFLWGRFLARGTCRAYLLDGTDLGELPTGAPTPSPAERPRSPRGR